MDRIRKRGFFGGFFYEWGVGLGFLNIFLDFVFIIFLLVGDYLFFYLCLFGSLER